MMYRILRYLRAREFSEYHQIRHYVVEEYIYENRPTAKKIFDKVFNDAVDERLIDEVGEISFKITEAGKDKFYSDDLRG